MCKKTKKSCSCRKGSCSCGVCGLIGKILGKVVLAGLGLFAVLFAVFFFDLDGKLMFYVVEPFLKKHYDNMDRKDTLKAPYDIDKFPKYEYDV